MSPIRIVELCVTIRETIVSFFSIFMFAALGVGIYLGILWVAPALQAAADQTFREGSYHNVQIQFPYGLTDDDIAQLEALAQIEARGYAEPFSADARTLHLIGVAFDSDTRRLSDWQER